MGSIVGWDLRSPGNAWRLEHNLRQGVMTTLCLDPSQNWLAVGTDDGAHICWDLRFRLPVTSVVHPAGSRVLRLQCHPTNQSCLVSAIQNNNEVSVWDWENQSRTLALWASPLPALSMSQQPSSHNVYSVFVGSRVASGQQDSPFVLTGGSDSRIRFWDLNHAHRSSLVSPGAYDPVQTKDLSYE
jgi:phosphoinositide-3-kinase regulatory subunit 4